MPNKRIGLSSVISRYRLYNHVGYSQRIIASLIDVSLQLKDEGIRFSSNGCTCTSEIEYTLTVNVRECM